MCNNYMIEVANLNKTFKKTIKKRGLAGSIQSLLKTETTEFEAVKNLSFNIPKGQIFGFIGANGAGKSTTIKMLTGILTPTSGKCTINGYDPQKDRKKYVQEIGVVFGQRTQLWWDLPLQETYSVLKEVYQVPDKEFRQRMGLLNEILDLHDFINDPVRTLSLGQRMRADIAASLLHRPKVLFLDEPTIGLDVSVKDKIRKAIATINQEEKTTILLTTHDLRDIELLCQRIYLIDRGEEIFDGSIEELKSRYGKIHEVIFKLETANDVDKLEYKEKFDCVDVKTDQNSVHVFFDVSKNPLPEIIKYTLTRVPIVDMEVKDSDIEDIVRRFIRKELNNDTK